MLSDLWHRNILFFHRPYSKCWRKEKGMIIIVLGSLVQLNWKTSVIFSNANLKLSKLNKHFKSVQGGTLAINDKETCKANKTFWSPKNSMKVCIYITKPLLEASYKVAYHVQKRKKMHTIMEELVKSCALEVVILEKDAKGCWNKFQCLRNCWYEPQYFGASDIKVRSIKISVQLDESRHCSL